ncbi:hypothetical protein BH10ACI4_BH10ACI4_26910 [soil metagenome]
MLEPCQNDKYLPGINVMSLTLDMNAEIALQAVDRDRSFRVMLLFILAPNSREIRTRRRSSVLKRSLENNPDCHRFCYLDLTTRFQGQR